jgi:hypothetical protein
MATTEDRAIAWQNRHGIKLVKAFGLDPSRVYDQRGIDLRADGGVEFNTLDGTIAFVGDNLNGDQRKALADFRRPTLEPEPTWRDVIRAMRAAVFHLKVTERDAAYRKWEVNDETGGFIAEIHREFIGGRYTWDLDIYGYRMYSVHLDNPPPADVLAAARLVKLLESQ